MSMNQIIASLCLTECALEHNVSSKEEFNADRRQAENAGAVIVKPAHEIFWSGYPGYFQDTLLSICGKSY